MFPPKMNTNCNLLVKTFACHVPHKLSKWGINDKRRVRYKAKKYDNEEETKYR